MTNRNVLNYIVLVLGLVLCLPVMAASVKAVALLEGRAMLSVDGGKAKIISEGKTLSGVKLISSNTSQAIVEVNGKRQTLKLNSSLVLEESLGTKPSNSYASSIQLFIDEKGFFRGDGSVNGKSINFLIDTGANIVVLNSNEAKRVGLDYKSGVESVAKTASGVAPMYLMTVERISIGGLELRNVETGIIEGNFPQYPLLGMSFLGQLKMQQDGKVMTISR